MTVVVTGAEGFLGAAVVATLEDVVSLRHGPAYTFDGRSAQLDLTRADQVDRLARELLAVSALVHCAAVTPFNRPCRFDDAPNQRMTENIIGLCNRLAIPRLVFISGWVVYTLARAPAAEGDPCAPVTAYGLSKLRTEQALRARLVRTVLVSARVSTVYGPGQRSRGLIPNLVEAGMAGGPLQVAAVRTRRDYLHVADAATTVRRLLDIDLTDHLDVNVGSGKSVAVIDVARHVQCVFADRGIDLAIACTDPPTEADPPDNRLDIERARRLGVCGDPRDLSAGLRDLLAWRAHLEVARRRRR